MRIGLISVCGGIHAFGLRILSSCLKKNGQDVTLILLATDFKKRYEDRILNEVAALLKCSDLIGISFMTNYFGNAVYLTQRLKRDLDIPIVWGGVHSTIRPQECLDYVDMVCIGEGEEALVELAKKMEDGIDHRNIDGIWMRDKGEIIRNKRRPLIQNLDDVPFQDHEYEGHYVNEGPGICKMSKGILERHMERYYWTMPTRGCPFGCSYCINNTLNNMYPNQNSIRKRSMDNIINELMAAKIKLPFTQGVYFDDDAFFLYSEEEIKDFCEKYKKNIGLPLVVTGVTPLTMNREKLSLLVDAGLRCARMGIQSGSERTMRLYKRNHSNQQIIKAAEIINEFKDKLDIPQYDIIVDNPWETDDDLVKTLMLLTKLPKPFHLAVYSLTFYPGTELYEKAKQEGLITNDLKDSYNKHYHRDRKRSYLNRLFLLLHDLEGRLSAGTMSLLTNKILMKLRLNWLIFYGIVIFNIKRNSTYVQYRHLLGEAMRDVCNGNWSRIARYFHRRIVNA